MKIFLYCQHVWGVGHFFRTLEICRALSRHEIIMVTGGTAVSDTLPDHIREIRLPAIMTDSNYSRLHTTEKGKSLEQVLKERQQMIAACFHNETPDLFIVELYPFGRKAFRSELDPILKGIRDRTLHSSKVVCSLRDILVEKKDIEAYEARVVKLLNRYFDALLVHSDPRLTRLDETFSRIADIRVPVVYTGFVTPKPIQDAGLKLRRRLKIGPDEIFIVASVGGGKVGTTLIEPVIKAFRKLPSEKARHLHVFCGPFMKAADFNRMRSYADKRVKVSRFTTDFLAYLDAADLSLSMAGYNTSMNILSTRVPALVWPFPHDREQGLRAARLQAAGALRILAENDLTPQRLAARMEQALSRPRPEKIDIDLDGALHTAQWLEGAAKPADLKRDG
jgi:predicted glycosyltransferase